MKFWKVLYRMFHGKALRFMSGTKSVGQVLRDSSHIGNYDPQETNINFAVPNTQTIINYTSMDYDFPKKIPPGIITSTLELKSKENSYILSVDGKKLSPGLNENSGDQDLFGHETSQTDSLQFSRERIEHEISLVQMTMANAWRWENWKTQSNYLINFHSNQGFKIFIPEVKDGFTKISEGSRRRLTQLSIRLRNK